MRYEILGSLRIQPEQRDQRAATINARNMQVVLATLLIRADEVVSVQQLSYEIWGERPPKRYLAAIHVYISQLRKLLARDGTTDTPIVTRSPGYLLHLDRDRLDAKEFQRLTDEGRQAFRLGRPEQAAAAFEAALGLWRGPALGDLRAGPILDGFIAWVEQARLGCVGMHVEAGLTLGRHQELVGRLYSLTSEHPLHEGFRRQLMIALYRSERQADALGVYGSTRRTLNHELGIEPGRALQDVHRAILLSDRSLDLDLSTAA
ncbi:BTAD domain-containing putative transcriptional regulator [Kitasatospora sp. NPDC048239]|uniref:AfsR/SARP family transcriptional regulator n=1 Tax=Kitasatospora sp. NPDC048239 TaxID=3364046 RepID=UPI00371175A4